MLKPVSVAVDVPLPRERVYDFLDVMADHQAFTDHFLTDWRCSGPERGVGAKARVTVRSGRVTDDVEIEVVEARPPGLIRERNVSARGRRVAYGTYELDELDRLDEPPGGGTRVRFTYGWERAPAVERLLGPVVRATMRRLNQRALDRLAERLSGRTA
jgi:hypothetical protein